MRTESTSGIGTDTGVGQIAARHPLATRVFARHKIDFCCGGGIPLARACESRGLDADAVLAEIREVLGASDDAETDWNEAPVEDLVRHILDEYHAPLREELPRLQEMAEKVAKVHGDKDPERLPLLRDVVTNLRRHMETHLEREETDLFPPILEHRDFDSGLAIFVEEHEDAGRALEQIRELTDDFQVPEGACNTWRALWHGLAWLEESTHRHVHLENNVLFSRLQVV